ncbi:hypothetical protein PsorP6_003034 [Peronosclerospora sorghi]|uniref:Uncharacterized protein n=1 Tax=Peronosclerospora sorghi TaxID=230839 RepID=A0ACC0VQN1_9STRA|nr:hypothetical protein PsorP6_003034 [Peronosclerospora sorghi]
MASLPTITDEHQARHYGRVRAKNILQPMHWKRIGTLSDEAARLYELARRPAAGANPDAPTTYTLRATKPLDASIAEIEAVLTGQTALLKAHDTSSSSLLPRLLPATYVSGKTLAVYPPLEIASTKERESVRIESARFKSHRLDTEPPREPGARRDAVEDYTILGYTLSTQLQRSSAKKGSKHGTAPILSVPSVLHLYRPVRAAAVAGAERRPDVDAADTVASMGVEDAAPHTDVKTALAPRGATMSVFQYSRLESLVTKHKSSRTAALVARGTPARGSRRAQIDLDLDPALAPPTGVRPRRTRTRQSQRSQGPERTSTFNPSASHNDNRRATLPSQNDLIGLESPITQSMRYRRANTVLLEDTPRPPLGSFSGRIKATSVRELSLSSSTRHARVDLATPEPDYDLDFNWFNIYPKAPIARSAKEVARASYVHVTGLKVDASSLVLLRQDHELQQYAERVLDVASAWHVASINLVGSDEVFCLVTASRVAAGDATTDRLSRDVSPVTIPDAMPREESVSAYAVHHDAVFFVRELAQDTRFRAHPIHTEQGAVSFLSFPIYASSREPTTCNAAAIASSSYCVATLDLWKRDHALGRRDMSHDWFTQLQELAHAMSARLDTVAREAHAWLAPLPRARATHSIGSSCDSRDSTRRADSMMDLQDMDRDSMLGLASPLLSPTETMDRVTNLSYAKVRGTHGLAATWKYDSDNESTTSSQSASSSCSQSSRFSSNLYTEMHLTMESLLQQASKTSQFLSETGVYV